MGVSSSKSAVNQTNNIDPDRMFVLHSSSSSTSTPPPATLIADCLSIVFSNLTIREISSAVRVDHAWRKVGEMKTSWQRERKVKQMEKEKSSHEAAGTTYSSSSSPSSSPPTLTPFLLHYLSLYPSSDKHESGFYSSHADTGFEVSLTLPNRKADMESMEELIKSKVYAPNLTAVAFRYQSSPDDPFEHLIRISQSLTRLSALSLTIDLPKQLWAWQHTRVEVGMMNFVQRSSSFSSSSTSLSASSTMPPFTPLTTLHLGYDTPEAFLRAVPHFTSLRNLIVSGDGVAGHVIFPPGVLRELINLEYLHYGNTFLPPVVCADIRYLNTRNNGEGKLKHLWLANLRQLENIVEDFLGRDGEWEEKKKAMEKKGEYVPKPPESTQPASFHSLTLRSPYRFLQSQSSLTYLNVIWLLGANELQLHPDAMLTLRELHVRIRSLTGAKEGHHLLKISDGDENNNPILPNLEVFHLGMFKLDASYFFSEESFHHVLSSMPNLTELHLDASPVSFIPLLECLPKLRHLHLILRDPRTSAEQMKQLYQVIGRMKEFVSLTLEVHIDYLISQSLSPSPSSNSFRSGFDLLVSISDPNYSSSNMNNLDCELQVSERNRSIEPPSNMKSVLDGLHFPASLLVAINSSTSLFRTVHIRLPSCDAPQTRRYMERMCLPMEKWCAALRFNEKDQQSWRPRMRPEKQQGILTNAFAAFINNDGDLTADERQRNEIVKKLQRFRVYRHCDEQIDTYGILAGATASSSPPSSFSSASAASSEWSDSYSLIWQKIP